MGWEKRCSLGRVRIGVLLVLAALAIGLSGCQRFMKRPDDAITEVVPLKQAMRDHGKNIDALRFPEVVLEYYGEGNRIKVRQLILVKGVDAVRIQTRVPASEEILSLLVTQNGHFTMHDRQSNDAYQGPSSPKNIARLLPVDLTPRDLVSILKGGAPWDKIEEAIKKGGVEELTWDGTKGLSVYRVAAPGQGSLSVWVRHHDSATQEVEQRDEKGEVLWHYGAESWKSFGPLELPTYRRFVMPARDLDFSLETERVDLNPHLPDQVFELEPPLGSRLHLLD